MPEIYQQYKQEYEKLFNECAIKTNKYDEIDSYIDKMVTNKHRYQTVSDKVNIPWYFIAIVHCMEGSLSFNKHLHNGDPLTARTVQVPTGRPTAGNPPFEWENSALDALTYEGFTNWSDWTISGMLYCFERYNGFGYRKYGINSPYLWSYSNLYLKGKFTVDGHFDPESKSKQIGAAVFLRRMSEKNIAIKGEIDIITQIKLLGEEVIFDPDNIQDNAIQLQKLLNSVGVHLKVDGLAGRNTSDSYKIISGKYLKGDPHPLA
jgi:lysozyme family protein